LVDAAFDWRDEWDVFFGVGLRRCPSTHNILKCPHKERGADHVSRLPAAWGDFDVQCPDEPDKPHASLDELLQLLRCAAPPPDLLVGSGMGAHGYWTLSAPTTDLDRVERINRSLKVRFQGDNAIDPARILRIAGTFNYKHGDRLPVRLLEVRR
jgi:hypothetical protein